MAKPNSQQKSRIERLIIVVFVIICVSLLVMQVGMNVRDTLDQERTSNTQPKSEIAPTPTLAGPTPTLDFSVPVSESDF